MYEYIYIYIYICIEIDRSIDIRIHRHIDVHEWWRCCCWATRPAPATAISCTRSRIVESAQGETVESVEGALGTPTSAQHHI